MKLLLLILLAGLCSGQQYPLQYRYQYRARVAAGIPEINEHHAAVSDLRAELDVFVSSPSTVVFRLRDVELGEFNGDTPCESSDLHEPLPVEYVTQGPGGHLGQNFFAMENGANVFAEDEPQWVVNVYKSIMGLFSIAPLTETFFGASENYSRPRTFEEEEDTIMGICLVSYSQHKLSGAALSAVPTVADDCQTGPSEIVSPPGSKVPGGRKVPRGRKVPGRGRKTPSKTSPLSARSCPEIGSNVWELVRSLNLGKCIQRVEHQHTLSGINCDLSEDQCKNLLSRNSHGVYRIRGDENGMRLEQAEVKGAIVISPYGYKTEHLQTITQQGIYLREVGALAPTDAPDVHQTSMRSENHLLYELVIPYPGVDTSQYLWAIPGTMKQTMEALTGVHVTDAIQEENENRVIALLNQVNQILLSGSKDQAKMVPVLLNYASIITYEFTELEILKVVAATDSRPQSMELLWDMLAEVGTLPAVNVLLTAMEEGQIGPFKQIKIYGVLNNNIKSATPLKPLMDNILRQDLDSHPVLLSHLTINFASLVKRLCLTAATDSFSTLARSQCEQDQIAEKFEEYLTSELDATTKPWKQMVLVRSLVKLKSLTAMHVLLPYVLGAKQSDALVRSLAMDILAKWHAPGHLFYQSAITHVLLDILENPAEDRLLRSRALGYLITWPISSTLWSRLAFFTHRPGNKDLSALTYSIIKATSEYRHPEMMQQMQFAAHALTLARPFSVAERYSSFRTWYRYSFADQIGLVDHIAIIKNPTNPVPSELALYMRRSYGGTICYTTKADIRNLARLLSFGHGGPPDESQSGRWTTFLDMLKRDLNIAEKVRQFPGLLANFKSITGLEIFLVGDRDFMEDLQVLYLSVMQQIDSRGQMSMYTNARDTTFVTVNDIGLPVIVSIAEPTVTSYGAEFDESQRQLLQISNLRFLSSGTRRTNLETLILWSKTKVSTGISQSFVLNFHTDLSLSVKPIVSVGVSRHPADLLSRTYVERLYLKLAPSVFENVTVLERHNTPYTILRDTTPANIEVLAQAMKVIHSGAPVLRHAVLDTAVGRVRRECVGQHQCAQWQTLANGFMSGEDNFEKSFYMPDLKFSMLKVTVDWSSSQGSALVFNFTIGHLDRQPSSGRPVSHYGQDSFEEHELCGSQQQQEMQSTGQQFTQDYMDQTDSQFSQSPQDEYESFGSFGTQQPAKGAERYSALDESTDTETVRPSQGIGDVGQPQLWSFLHYLQREAGWTSRVDGLSLRVELTKHDEVTDAIEAVMGYTVCYSLPDRQRTQFVLVVARKDDECSTECVEGVTEQAKLNDLDTLALIMAKNHTRTNELNFYHGAKCRSGPYLTVKGLEMISPPGLEAIQEALTSKQACHTEPKDGVQVEPIDLVEEFHKVAKFDAAGFLKNFTMTRDSDNSCSVFVSPVQSAYEMFRKNILKLPPKTDQCQRDGQTIPYTVRIVDSRLLSGAGMVVGADEGYRFAEILTGGGQVENFLPFPGFLAQLHHLTSPFDRDHSDYCVISPSSNDSSSNSFYLTTFDKRFEKIELDSCPVLAATPCAGHLSNSFALAVKLNRDNSLAMNIASQFRQLVITIDADGVEINREPMEANAYVQTMYYTDKDGHQKEAGHVYRRNGFYKIEVVDSFEILFKEGKFYIKLAEWYRGYSCGICGNLDGEPSDDLASPNGCLVSDTRDFVKMWTPSTSFDCSPLEQPSIDSCITERPLPHDYYQQYQI